MKSFKKLIEKLPSFAINLCHHFFWIASNCLWNRLSSTKILRYNQHTSGQHTTRAYARFTAAGNEASESRVPRWRVRVHSRT